MNEALADKLRKALAGRKAVSEKRMFGGACFLLRGNMLCGTGKADFMFRVGKEQDAEALSRKGARPMDITGKVMKGFVWVDPASCDARSLARWLRLAEAYVGMLPAKSSKDPKGGGGRK
jgi:hypothetical protein